ncbi:PAS domain-containing protein [Marivibrio halodurans]|uniref:PAS domain-containing protein n=1 Tax=Marivibrio halodurans TaxID=2039722 RepID=A0A8J7S2G9_9PROT|nr:PAS domain-containing protein [Marivibrio halodurans]MBP5855504.1 PAS domain-containing protein [Marivibrio halodurans]
MIALADVEAGATFVMDIDEAGTILRCIGRTYETLGLSPAALQGISLYDLVSEDDIWLASDAVETVMTNGGSYEDRVGFNDHGGNVVPFRVKIASHDRAARARRVQLHAMRDEGDALTLGTFETDGINDLSGILEEVEDGLRGDRYDSPTLSIFSLDIEAGDETDVDAIVAAAERMAKSVHRTAAGRATSFRVDRNTVSVLHGTDFDAEAASTKASRAAGPSFAVGRAGIDLSDADLDVQEKLDLIESTITAARFAAFTMPDGTMLSAGEARTAIATDLTGPGAGPRYDLEIAHATDDGRPRLALLTFHGAMNAIGETPTKGEIRMAGDLLAIRMEQASAVAVERGVPACVAMDATMLARLGRRAVESFREDVLVLATGVGRLSPRDGERFAAVFCHASRTIVDGTDLATSSALQRLIAKTDSLEFIRVPESRFGDDPTAAARDFRQIARLCATRSVSLYVNGVSDTSTALALKDVPDICIGGPAIFPELFKD